MKTGTVLAGLAGVLLAGAIGVAQQSDRVAPIKLPTVQPMLDGPFTHRNLSVYVLYFDRRPPADTHYITLAEGVKAGTVTITEAKRETVGTLLITNRSEHPLFLQAGELVSGGKQDRVLRTSLVIPAKSVEAPIPSLCVERNRWSGGKGLTALGKLAPSSVNAEAQVADQSGVWRNVGAYKSKARAVVAKAGGPRVSRTSSVNEELKSKEFEKLTGEYERALRGVLGRFSHPVGIAAAVNGRILSVDIYQSESLFRKLFPKLLNAAASEAAADVTDGRVQPPTTRQVADFIAGAWGGKQTIEKLGYGNVWVRMVGHRATAGQLTYRKQLVHSQILRRGPVPVPVPVPIPRPRPIPEPRGR
jgi:hypothetical protein